MIRFLASTLLVTVLLPIAACSRNDNDAAADEQALAEAETSHVRLAPLTSLIQALPLSAQASVLAPNESLLSAEVSAPVRRVHADVGATVAEGDLLVELDSTDARLALAQADARLAAARARANQVRQRLQRAQALVERNFVAEDEISALDAEYEAARAEVEIAQADRSVAARSVEKCRLRAPFDGVVVERQAQVGVLAAIGAPLVRLVDLAPAEIEANLQQSDAERIDQAEALVFESQGRSYPVQLLRLVPMVERNARTRTARLGFVDEAAPVGSSGRLRAEIPARQLPARLMVRRDDALGVFVAARGKARFVPVPGASEGRPFEVDLPMHTRIVVEGHQGLNDGDAIDDSVAAD